MAIGRQRQYFLLHLALQAAASSVLCLAAGSSTPSTTRPVAAVIVPPASASSSSSFQQGATGTQPELSPSILAPESNTTSAFVTPSTLLATTTPTRRSSSIPSLSPPTTTNMSIISTTWNKLVRRVKVFVMAGQVFLSYKSVQRQEVRIRKRLGLDDDGDSHAAVVELWDTAHQRNAKIILAAIEDLQGFWIKVGQYLSSRADVMPPQYLSILATLQDGLPPKPFAEIQATLWESQLSEKALARIVEIDPVPLSTASLAQVHRAKLDTGESVVIKAQHRGVAALMLQDMDNLRTILRLLARFEPDLDYNPLVDEYSKEVRKELDFRTEAVNMESVGALLRERGIRAIVPAVVHDLVTEKILVMEFCEGFSIRDIEKLDEHKVDRYLLLERVCRSWAAQMHIGGLFNADPHPGNILVSTSETDGDASVPVLLDFGLTKRFDDDMRVAFARLVHSSHETDMDGLLQSFEEMGLVLNRYDPFQDMRAMQASFADPAPQSQAVEAKKQRTKENEERQAVEREKQGLKKGQKLRNPVDAWPSELIFFTRVSAMLRGLCSRLEVRYPYLACMAEAAGETVRQAVPADEHASSTVYELPAGETVDTNLQRKLGGLAQELIDEDHAIGMQVSVIHKGKVVANIAAGTLGTVNPRPVTPSSLFNVFSVSKAVLAAGTLHMLQEKGISVDDPIAKYWPEFGASNPLKASITIRHALSHQSGLANAFPSDGSIETLTNWEKMKSFIASTDAVPSHTPGEETHYHYLTFAWIVGGLMEKVTGEPYEKYLDEHLIGPLGLKKQLHMGGLPDEIAKEELAVLTARVFQGSGDKRTNQEAPANRAKFQVAEQLMNPSIFNMRKIRSAKIPSANGHASAYALAALMSAVTDSKFLSPKMLAQASTPQQAATQTTIEGSSSAMLDNASAGFGLGWQIHDLTHLKSGTVMQSVGHAGLGGSIVIAMPGIDASIAFTTNQLSSDSAAKKRVLSLILQELGLQAPSSLVGSSRH